jgi:hypothetical protein
MRKLSCMTDNSVLKIPKTVALLMYHHTSYIQLHKNVKSMMESFVQGGYLKATPWHSLTAVHEHCIGCCLSYTIR